MCTGESSAKKLPKITQNYINLDKIQYSFCLVSKCKEVVTYQLGLTTSLFWKIWPAICYYYTKIRYIRSVSISTSEQFLPRSLYRQMSISASYSREVHHILTLRSCMVWIESAVKVIIGLVVDFKSVWGRCGWDTGCLILEYYYQYQTALWLSF